jgi:hypothetical protein
VAGGDINVSDLTGMTLAGAVALGNVTVHAPSLNITGPISGTLVQLAGDSGITDLGNINSTGLLLNASAGDINIGGGSSAPYLTSTGNVTFVANNINFAGSNGTSGQTTSLTANGTMAFTATGNMTLTGGSGASGGVEVVSTGNATITAGGSLVVQGGSGLGSFAVLDPTGTGTNMLINAKSVNILGGSGNGAYAVIGSDGNLTTQLTNGISLTAGSGPSAFALLLAPIGNVSVSGTSGATITKTGLNPLAANPLLLNSTIPVAGYLDSVSASLVAPPASQEQDNVAAQVAQFLLSPQQLVTIVNSPLSSGGVLNGTATSSTVIVQGADDANCQ